MKQEQIKLICSKDHVEDIVVLSAGNIFVIKKLSKFCH